MNVVTETNKVDECGYRNLLNFQVPFALVTWAATLSLLEESFTVWINLTATTRGPSKNSPICGFRWTRSWIQGARIKNLFRAAWRGGDQPASLQQLSSGKAAFSSLWKHPGVFCKVLHLDINASDRNSQSHSSFSDHLAVGQVVDVPEGEAGDGLLVGGVGLPNLQTQLVTKASN